MYRALRELKDVLNEIYPILKYDIINAMISYVLYLGRYFTIPLIEIEIFFKRYPIFSQRLFDLDEFKNLSQSYEVKQQIANKFEQEIFNDILQSIALYFDWIERIQNFDNNKIPKPPAEHTVEINNNGIRFEIDTNTKTTNFGIEDFDEITYALL